MATSGDKSFNQYCTEIVTDALTMAGLIKVGNNVGMHLKTYALSILNKMVMAWQNEKVYLWTIDNDQTQAFESGISRIVMDETYIELQNVRLKNLQTNTELTLSFKTMKEFSEIGQKEMSGVPNTYTIQRVGGQLAIVFYPVPDDNIVANYEFVFDAVTLLEFFKFYANTGNFPASWLEACTFGLAYRLNPKDQSLLSLADSSFKKAKNSDFEQGDVQFSPNE